jgi:tripeptidyl-peptidase-1
MKTFYIASLALSTASAARVVMEPDVPAGKAFSWRHARLSATDGSETITTTFMLKHDAAKVAELEETFWAVSDPRNARYGEHLKQEEVHALLTPAGNASATVRAWLVQQGASSVSAPTPDTITAVMPVKAAGAAFNTTFALFEHTERGSLALHRATAPYSLPQEIAALTAVVGGVLRFPGTGGLPKVVDASAVDAAAWDGGCAKCQAGFVTPAIIAQAYSLGDLPTTAATGNSMSTSEFQGQYWTQTSMDAFGAACKIADVKIANEIGKQGTNAGVEAVLDVEYIKGIGGAIPLTNIYDAQYSLESWAQQLSALADGTLPLINSVSYGNDEIQQTGAAYMEACNTQFMGFGARGASILFASGDQGVYGRTGAGILKNKPFHPDFPAGSPYITAVGGTDFSTKGVVGAETAWTSGGGGFSNEFAIPSYQTDAVAGYKTTCKNLPPAALWNNSGRGYPDVAALGGQVNPYCVFVQDSPSGVAGTSAACPVVAGVFARLNDVRLAKGGKPLGFLNPFIYQNAAGFNDVTAGDNKDKGKYGFEAVKGWDPATGMGSPNFAKLAKLV